MDTVIRDPYREALEAATGVSVRELFAGRDGSAYPAFERGELAEEAYWATYDEAGFPVDVEVFHAARRAGYRWLPGMRELLDELTGEVERVVASNYPRWIDEVAATFLGDAFDAVHASCHLGARKPDPDFYTALLGELDAAPGEVAFVDDREANVAAARAVGLHATVFAGADELRAWLGQLGIDVSGR